MDRRDLSSPLWLSYDQLSPPHIGQEKGKKTGVIDNGEVVPTRLWRSLAVAMYDLFKLKAG